MYVPRFRILVSLVVFLGLNPLLRAVEIGSWEMGAALPAPRQEVGVAIVSGKIYVVGGFDEQGRSVNTVERYDPAINEWEEITPLPAPAPLNHVGAASAGGKLYVIGGLRQSFSAVDTLYCYDPVTEKWSQRSSLPQPRGAMGVATIDGRVFAAGGLPRARNRDFAVYDPDVDSWTTLPEMPTGRDHLAAVAIEGEFYAFSGRNRGVLQVATEMYDLASGAWSSVAPIPTPRGGIAAGALHGRAYVFGGEGNPASPDGVFDETEEYDPLTDSWRALADMPEGRHGIGAAVHEGRIFIPGGGNREGLGATDRNDAFTPPSRTVVTFDGTPSLGSLTGHYDGIDWGLGGWLTFGKTFGACQGPLAVSSRPLAAFDFIRPSVLNEIETGPVTGEGWLLVVAIDLDGAMLEARLAYLSAQVCQTIETDFSTPSAGIRLLFQGGVFTIDNVTYTTLLE